MRRLSRFESLGFRYELKLQWLDYALRLAISELTTKESRKQMEDMLSKEQTQSGCLGEAQIKKCLSLLSSWYDPDKELIHFRDQLLCVSKDIAVSDWVTLHWAVLAAHYPFFFQVTLILGRLFSLQGQINKCQIERRLVEVFGAMPVIERNMRYAIATLANLGFVQMNGRTGLYLPPERLLSTNFEQTAILWKALLHATKGGCASVTTLRNSPAFYPFSLTQIYVGQFMEAFDDIDCRTFAGGDEQICLKETM